MTCPHPYPECSGVPVSYHPSVPQPLAHTAPLAYTGFATGWFITIALILVLVGFFILIGTRR